MDNNLTVSGNIVDVVEGRIYPGTIVAEGGRIVHISGPLNGSSQYILPGFIDAHVHIESSMLVPSEFARLAVAHGTVGAVCDPHEIANVLGIAGVRFMLDNASQVPFKFCFGAPSCVPATPFETAGAKLTTEDVEELLHMEEIGYLSEMMNFPGVLAQDPEVMAKIRAAKLLGKPIDGHAPGLRSDSAKTYAEAGISTDHECFSAEEAEDKIRFGMKILLREGSAAKNFADLVDLLPRYPESMMFCSDDKHPNDLVRGHIVDLVRRAISLGVPVMHTLIAATRNPVLHYGLDVGLLREGDPADFIVVDDLERLTVRRVYIDGRLVAENGKSLLGHTPAKLMNKFDCELISADDLCLRAVGQTIRGIEVQDGQLITKEIHHRARICNGLVESDLEGDVLMAVVLNRYEKARPALAFVKNFGLRDGALASSVAHDSHNIVAVGTSREYLARAINLVVKNRGGVAAVGGGDDLILPLPIGGLMSDDDGYRVADKYEQLDQRAKDLGSHLASPFMTLSFIALLVIPELKLSDKGLFDGRTMQFTSVFVD